MKNQILLILFLTLNTFPCLAQDFSSNKNIEALTNNFLLELKQQKIDTICLFQAYSVGGIITFDENEDSCEYEYLNTPTYVIWKQNSKSFLTKINSCNTYSFLEIDADKMWKIYFQNKQIIKKEKVKPFQIIVFDNGKKRIMTIGVDHSYHENFLMLTDKNIKHMNFDDYYFKKYLSGDEKKKENINYEYNTTLKSKIVVDEISKVVYDNEKKLTKTKIGKP